MTARIITALNAAIGKLASSYWYHGSPVKFDAFKTTTEHTFGSEAAESPLFFTKNEDFARTHAGANGFVYIVRLRITHAFDPHTDLISVKSRYSPPPYENLTYLGKVLYDDLEANRIFPDLIQPNGDGEYEAFQDSQGVWNSITNANYDIMETSEMRKWMRAHGFDAFYVTGDGTKNVAVFDPAQVEIVGVYPASEYDYKPRDNARQARR